VKTKGAFCFIAILKRMAETHGRKFPEGFYWGAATAAYQVEGGIENTDWAEAARERRVPTCGRACDHYNRFEEDFNIAKSLGHNAHRFSVEWARIEPEEGKFNEEAIEHYRKVLLALRERGLRPYLTLWHFTLPSWFSKKGGFERRNSPKLFARYAKYVAEQLGDLTEGISTMNEPMVFASNGWIRGTWPPFKRFSLIDSVFIPVSGTLLDTQAKKGIMPFFAYVRVIWNLVKAHKRAYKAIKKVYKHLDVSIVMHVILFHSNNQLINRMRAWLANYHWTYWFMHAVYKRCDSIGLNYYIHKKYGDTETYQKTDMNWDIYPQGIYDALIMLSHYKKPLFVSEAGIADADDSERTQYIKDQVYNVWRAIEDGADVRGHMYWSLLDNYEWSYGFDKRFGLVEINYETLERKIRPSAYVYKAICESNEI
jgi:beta-glucosidase